jgi:hypothetical protein
MFVKLSIFSSIFFRNFELCCNISAKRQKFLLANDLNVKGYALFHFRIASELELTMEEGADDILNTTIR